MTGMISGEFRRVSEKSSFFPVFHVEHSTGPNQRHGARKYMTGKGGMAVWATLLYVPEVDTAAIKDQ